MTTKKCTTCHENYKPKRQTQVYCSAACQRSRGTSSVNKECIRDGCTETFVSLPMGPKKYCSKSCATRVNNTVHVKRTLEGACVVCSEKIPSDRKYCAEHRGSYRAHQSRARVESWLSGDWSGGSVRSLSDTIRLYLLEEAGYSCSECGFDTPHPVDGHTVLEIDHIDGDGSNHSPENLRVLCPNCHALTPTYRARNIGNGRRVYYLRVLRDQVDEEPESVV